MVKRASGVGGPPFEYQADCRKSNATILKYRRIAIVGCVFMGGVLLEGVCMVGTAAAAAAAMVGAIILFFGDGARCDGVLCVVVLLP